MGPVYIKGSITYPVGWMMKQKDKRDEFIEILIKLGPTILGVKPAEIINIKLGTLLDKLKECMGNYPKIDFLEIKEMEKYRRMQVFFYHKEALSKILSQKVNRDFLVNLGYPAEFNLHRYLQILKEKLLSEEFPHEIGIFLGYPLKDVLGFMGEYSLELVDIQGWRYYGSRKLSEIHYRKFVEARETFKFFLKEVDNPEEFYYHLKDY